MNDRKRDPGQQRDRIKKDEARVQRPERKNEDTVSFDRPTPPDKDKN